MVAVVCRPLAHTACRSLNSITGIFGQSSVGEIGRTFSAALTQPGGRKQPSRANSSIGAASSAGVLFAGKNRGQGLGNWQVAATVLGEMYQAQVSNVHTWAHTGRLSISKMETPMTSNIVRGLKTTGVFGLES